MINIGSNGLPNGIQVGGFGVSGGKVHDSNIIVNGRFDTDTDWTKGVGASISGGSLSWDGSSLTNSDGDTYQAQSLIQGETYLLTTEIVVTSGSFRFGFYDGANGQSGTFTENCTASFEYTSPRTSNAVAMRVSAGALISIDNVTCRKISPAKGVIGV